MKSRVWWYGWALIAAVGGSTAADNLAPSADFEAAFGAAGLPAGWSFFQDEAGQYTTAREVAGDHGATLRIGGRGTYGGAFAARTPIAADRSYLAGGLVKVEGEGQATVKLDYAAGETYLGSSFAGFVKAGDGWRAVRVKDRRAEYPTATHIVVAVAIEGVGQAWFDNVYLEPVARFASDTDNLASEGTVETGVGPRAWGWELFHPEGAAPQQAEATAAAAHTGRAGLHLAGSRQYAVFAHEPRPLDRAQRYTLTGWVRCRAGAAMVKMDFLGPEGWLGQQQAAYAAADGQWHELRLDVDLGLYPAAVMLAPAVTIEGDGADADFDDLVLLAEAP